MKYFLTLAALVGFASAACPNSCSGHGTCNRYDACTCFLETSQDDLQITVEAEWTGADCSRRTCPRGTSWTMSKSSSGTASDLTCMHETERECSDQGLCDRATGLCACFPGYTGSSCQRTACPDDCSGHGTCRSNRDFAYDWAIAKTDQIHNPADVGTGDRKDVTEEFDQVYKATYKQAWDTDMHYGCKCDAGYRGASCAMVECPSANDPLDDKCVELLQANNWLPQVADITNYQLQYDAPFGAAGWEEAYSNTKDANDQSGTFDALKPNWGKNTYYVLDNNGRKVYGCYGKISGMDCSGRGICDYSSGTCKCFTGYAGTACEGVEEMA